MSGCPGAGLGEQGLPEGAGGPVLVLQEGAVGGLRSAPGRCSTQLCTELLVFPGLPCSCASWLGWEEQTERTSPVFSSLPRHLAVAAAVVCPRAAARCLRSLSDSRAAGRANGVWLWDRQHLGLDPACRCRQESKEAVRFKVTGRNPSPSAGSLVHSLGEPVSPLG